MFDVPLLESRYRLNRARFPLSEAPHLDLLHPARRLWKARLESCRLQSLEARAPRPAARGRHPRRGRSRRSTSTTSAAATRAPWRGSSSTTASDIVSLAALSVLACQWVEEGRAEDPRDVLSLARVLERARLYERSDAEYRRALDERPRGRCADAALLRLACARQARRGARAGRGALGRGGRGRRAAGPARAGHPPRAPQPAISTRRSRRSSAGCPGRAARPRDARAWHLAEGFERRQRAAAAQERSSSGREGRGPAFIGAFEILVPARRGTRGESDLALQELHDFLDDDGLREDRLPASRPGSAGSCGSR